jgi:hypothetical protein
MSRRFLAPWREEKFSGGYVVRDATGQALAYLYARSTESEAIAAKRLTMDEARRIAVNSFRISARFVSLRTSQKHVCEHFYTDGRI